MASDRTETAKGAKVSSPMEIWVARARGVGGIVGFVIAFWVCRGQGFAVADAVFRGLAGAVVMSLVAWWSALLVIQALMRTAADQAQREAQAAAAEAAAAQQAAAAELNRPASAASVSGEIS